MRIANVFVTSFLLLLELFLEDGTRCTIRTDGKSSPGKNRHTTIVADVADVDVDASDTDTSVVVDINPVAVASSAFTDDRADTI